jgi:hypothetical protein
LERLSSKSKGEINTFQHKQKIEVILIKPASQKMLARVLYPEVKKKKNTITIMIVCESMTPGRRVNRQKRNRK